MQFQKHSSNYTKFCHKVRILKTLKQMLQLESIPCVYLRDILERLLAKRYCFDATFMCLSRFVAFRLTFNAYGC